MGAYQYVTEMDVYHLVRCAVSSGKMPQISEEEIKNLTETINATMRQMNLIEKIPYGRDNYKNLVDEIFAGLTE